MVDGYDIDPNADLYHDRLGVGIDSDGGEIREAAKEAMSMYHPDRGVSDTVEAWDKIQQAREILSDERERSEYQTFCEEVSDPGLATELFESWRRKGKPINPVEWIEQEIDEPEGNQGGDRSDDSVVEESEQDDRANDPPIGHTNDLGGGSQSDESRDSDIPNTGKNKQDRNQSKDAITDSFGDTHRVRGSGVIATLTNMILTWLGSNRFVSGFRHNMLFSGITSTIDRIPVNESVRGRINKGLKMSVTGVIATAIIFIFYILSALVPYVLFGPENVVTAIVIPLGSLVLMPSAGFTVVMLAIVALYTLIIVPLEMIKNANPI